MGATITQLEASLAGATENLDAAVALFEETRDRLEAARRKQSDILSIRQAFLIIVDDLRWSTDSPTEAATAMTLAVEGQNLGHEIEVSEAQESVLAGKFGDAADIIEELCEALVREAEEVTA